MVSEEEEMFLCLCRDQLKCGQLVHQCLDSVISTHSQSLVLVAQRSLTAANWRST